MHPLKLLLPALLAASPSLATPADDMRRLATACTSAASVVNASLNSTAAVNTTTTIQTLIYAIGASTANLNSTNATVAWTPWSPTTNTTTIDNTPPGAYDTPYLAYLASINTFADAVTRRGEVPHGEPNAPVYRRLQSLAGAVHAYGLGLRDRGMISLRATISTITAGSYVIQAQSTWADDRDREVPRGARVVRRERKGRRVGPWVA